MGELVKPALESLEKVVVGGVGADPTCVGICVGVGTFANPTCVGACVGVGDLADPACVGICVGAGSWLNMFVFVEISEPEGFGGGADPTCVGACCWELPVGARFWKPPLAKKLALDDPPDRASRVQRLP